MFFRNPSEPLLPFCHDLACCVSVLGSIISYGLIKTLAIIEIPPLSLWSQTVVFRLVPTPPPPGQSSGLRFSPSAAAISEAETGVSDHCGLSDPVSVHPTRQPEDSDR